MSDDQRCFLVTYSILEGVRFTQRVHLLSASSRKDAENSTRFLEEPKRIKINRVVPITSELFEE